MKTQLLPYTFKKLGLAIFIVASVPSFVAGVIDGYNVTRYDVTPYNFLPKETIHVLDIIGIIGLAIYALSKDKVYDELLQRLRLEAIRFTFVASMLVVMLGHIFVSEFKVDPSYLINLQVLCFIGVYYFKKQNIASIATPGHIA